MRQKVFWMWENVPWMLVGFVLFMVTFGVILKMQGGVTWSSPFHRLADRFDRLETMQTEVIEAVEHVADHRPATVRERIIDLPDDGQAYHVSLCLHDDWRTRPLERRLVAWWQTEPRLVGLKAQSLYHLYVESTPHFRNVLSRAIDVPCVLIQRADGKVIYKASGENIPATVTDLGGVVAQLFPDSGLPQRPFYILPWRRPKPCPGPCPGPEPEPKPTPDLDEEGDAIVDVPDLVPDTPKPEPGFPWSLAVLAGLGGGVVPVVRHFRREILA